MKFALDSFLDKSGQTQRRDLEYHNTQTLSNDIAMLAQAATYVATYTVVVLFSWDDIFTTFMKK